jgi:membrane-associated phospholipid phosphatase
MPHRGLFTLPPSRIDVAIARKAVRAATPTRERTLRAITWLADEKILLGTVGLFWLNVQLRSANKDVRHEANIMLLNVGLAGLLPHLFKYLVDRKRPDRTLAHGRRHGIPRSGDPWDSFPSGHTLHLGAIVGPLTRLAPKRVRPLVWLGICGLASTRILLLAHYTSDVIAGLGIGAALGRV